MTDDPDGLPIEFPRSFVVLLHCRASGCVTADSLYVANADSVEVTKFLNYVTTISSTVSTVATDVVVTKDAVDGRHVLGRD